MSTESDSTPDRILIPYDGSEPADAALEFALTERPDATFVVLHVVEPFPDHTAAGTDEVRSDWRERAREYAEEAFERPREVAADHGAEIETGWVYGHPRREIVRYVEDEPITEVVMGSHGWGPIGRFVLGSVAEAVIRRSPVPVTVVRRYPDDQPG